MRILKMPDTIKQTIVSKADLLLSELANAGRLTPAQARLFTRTLMNSPTILQQARVVEMPTPEYKIARIGFGSRILRPAPLEGVELPAEQRAKPDLGQITITTKEVIAEIHLPYSVLEDNIEGGSINVGNDESAGGLMDTLIVLMAQRAALDLEELALLGDTAKAATDAYLGLLDGWLKKASVNTVVSDGKAISQSTFVTSLKTLPKPYHRNLADLRWYASTANAIDATALQASRQTALGDQQLATMAKTTYLGVTVESSAMMPETDMLLTNPKNLIFGIHRDIHIEYQKNIRKRVYEIVLTARVGVEIEDVSATVKTTNLNTTVTG